LATPNIPESPPFSGTVKWRATPSTKDRRSIGRQFIVRRQKIEDGRLAEDQIRSPDAAANAHRGERRKSQDQNANSRREQRRVLSCCRNIWSKRAGAKKEARASAPLAYARRRNLNMAMITPPWDDKSANWRKSVLMTYSPTFAALFSHCASAAAPSFGSRLWPW